MGGREGEGGVREGRKERKEGGRGHSSPLVVPVLHVGCVLLLTDHM